MCVGLFITGIATAGVGGLRPWLRQRRRQRLLSRYGDAAAVQRIMARQVWQGMSMEQLVDSWGTPADTGRGGAKAEVWTYGRRSRTRFAVQGGLVVGWDAA